MVKTAKIAEKIERDTLLCLIYGKIQRNINQIVNQLPAKKRQRADAGLSTIALRRFQSVNDAGRMLAPMSFNTGISRIRRCLGDVGLVESLSRKLYHLVLRSARGTRIYLNIDHTHFGDFTVAVIGTQTGQGRSQPIWSQVNVGRNKARIKPLVLALSELLADLPDSVKKKLTFSKRPLVCLRQLNEVLR